MGIGNSYEHLETLAAGLGYSIKELYEKADIDLSTRTRWKNGTTNPNTSTLQRLEDVINNHNKSKVKKSKRSN